jgi:hypothetical protein
LFLQGKEKKNNARDGGGGWRVTIIEIDT